MGCAAWRHAEMLALAVEAERRVYLDAHTDELDATGRRLAVGNGSAGPREVMTGAGDGAGHGTPGRPSDGG